MRHYKYCVTIFDRSLTTKIGWPAAAAAVRRATVAAVSDLAGRDLVARARGSRGASRHAVRRRYHNCAGVRSLSCDLSFLGR